MIELLLLAGAAVAAGLLAHATKRQGHRTNVASRNGTDYYRTQDGMADYEFSYEQQRDGSWRAYIVSQPSYGTRDTGPHATHRLTDDGCYYVCWDSPVWSKEEVQKVAALWADWTQVYIKTGVRPGNEWIAAWRPQF